MTTLPITPETILSLQQSLMDAAALIRAQGERVKALESALTLIAEMDGDQPARTDWGMVRIARAALGVSS